MFVAYVQAGAKNELRVKPFRSPATACLKLIASKVLRVTTAAIRPKTCTGTHNCIRCGSTEPDNLPRAGGLTNNGERNSSTRNQAYLCENQDRENCEMPIQIDQTTLRVSFSPACALQTCVKLSSRAQQQASNPLSRICTQFTEKGWRPRVVCCCCCSEENGSM